MTDMTLAAGQIYWLNDGHIVAAYVSNHVVPVSDLANLISDVHSALSNTSTPAPAITVVKSEAGGFCSQVRPGRSDHLPGMRRQLQVLEAPSYDTSHALAGRVSRKWDLPADYPWSHLPMRKRVRASPRKWVSVSAARQITDPLTLHT